MLDVGGIGHVLVMQIQGTACGTIQLCSKDYRQLCLENSEILQGSHDIADIGLGAARFLQTAYQLHIVNEYRLNNLSFLSKSFAEEFDVIDNLFDTIGLIDNSKVFLLFFVKSLGHVVEHCQVGLGIDIVPVSLEILPDSIYISPKAQRHTAGVDAEKFLKHHITAFLESVIKDNLVTSRMFDKMNCQILQHPTLAVGGLGTNKSELLSRDFQIKSIAVFVFHIILCFKTVRFCFLFLYHL